MWTFFKKSQYVQYSTSNPFSIHRLLPGPGSPMHPSLSKAELHYNDYALQNHTLHHDSMYYNPPVYQVCSNPELILKYHLYTKSGTGTQKPCLFLMLHHISILSQPHETLWSCAILKPAAASTLTSSRFVIKTFKLPFAGPQGVLPTQILITKGFPRISSFDIARTTCRMLNRPPDINHKFYKY